MEVLLKCMYSSTDGCLENKYATLYAIMHVLHNDKNYVFVIQGILIFGSSRETTISYFRASFVG